MRPGAAAEITIMRDKERKVLKVTMGEMPDGEKPVQRAERENALNGVAVQDLTPEMRRQLNIGEEIRGVIVSDVAANSPAFGKIVRGDVIQQVDRKDIESVADFDKASAVLKAKDTVLLLVYRNGGSLYLAIKP
jgi:serine protease Do